MVVGVDAPASLPQHVGTPAREAASFGQQRGRALRQEGGAGALRDPGGTGVAVVRVAIVSIVVVSHTALTSDRRGPQVAGTAYVRPLPRKVAGTTADAMPRARLGSQVAAFTPIGTRRASRIAKARLTTIGLHWL